MTLQTLNIAVKGCKQAALAADGMSIRAGRVRTVRPACGKQPPKIVSYGAVAGVEVQLAKANNTSLAWPADAAKSCTIVLDARRIQPNAVLTYRTASAARLAKCLQKLGLSYGGAYGARARAYYKPGPRALFVASEWSPVVAPNIVCTGNSTLCK